MAHTPGPLNVDVAFDAYALSPGRDVIVRFNSAHGRTEAQARELARLIASAPEMLALLRYIDFHAQSNQPPIAHENFMRELTDEARALLASLDAT